MPNDLQDESALTLALPASGGERTYIVIVGAGFSGLGLAIRLKQQGIEDFVILERGSDIGGTWRDNTYPGCACDVPSHLYSFSFAPNAEWSRKFSPQPEIQEYLRQCAKRFGIEPHIRWNTELLEAAWDESAALWRIRTTQGDISAAALALGNGPLSEPAIPAIPGLDRFQGAMFHSARWNHAHRLAGERVAVIGSGASAIQFTPRIQPELSRLLLFQRTPPWIIPREDHAIAAWQRSLFRAAPLTQRLVRDVIYWQREITAFGMVYQPAILRAAERLALRYLHAQIKDPILRAKLTPHYAMGCKRILLSDDYYPTLTRDNVEVITERIHEVKPAAIVTDSGREWPVDTIILATGFHVTDMPIASRVRGRGGATLADHWSAGAQAYLGSTVSGFPNLFILIGPNTGLGHNSMVFMIEAQVAYILDSLRWMKRHGAVTIEPRPQAQQAFNDTLQRRMAGTVWKSGCASWYLDAHGRNSTLWPGFTWEFWLRTRRFDPEKYIAAPHESAAPARLPV